MVRGTKVYLDDEARDYLKTIRFLEMECDNFCLHLNGHAYKFQPIILPALEDQDTFVHKAGSEILNTMYTFKDKGDRGICLIPEATAVIQKLYNEQWAKSRKKPVCLYYTQKCYRYDRPQEGRYREFTQFGIEILGAPAEDSKKVAMDFLNNILIKLSSCSDPISPFCFKKDVVRGLSYYTEQGFEVDCPALGAQKQIAGGGSYKEGVGWAMGVDRILLSKKIMRDISKVNLEEECTKKN